MPQKLLEILIPTYKRPQAAIWAIDSVLACADPRVMVTCHSNGPEVELEIAAAQRPAMRYGNFQENRGAVANFRKMLENSTADYVMFLSDEDQIDPRELTGFLDFLSSRQHGFVLCNVVEGTGAKYFAITPFRGEALSARDLLVLFTIHPTYMSGYCYRRDLLTLEVISEAFELVEANAYPHLLLRNSIAKRASTGLYPESLIVKGVEANVGGDSHTHIVQDSTEKPSNHQQLLNPRIYGQSARARQFYYLVPKLDRELKFLPAFERIYVKFYVLSAWLKITIDAHQHVDAAIDIPILSATINDYQFQNANAWDLICQYNRILMLRQKGFRNCVIKMMWHVSKLVKLALFIRRFGLFRTWAFVTGKPV